MPYSSASLHTPQPLVDFCVAYDPAEEGYLRNAFFPRKDVKHQTDLIHTIDTASLLRVYDLDVTGSSDVPEVQWKAGSDLTYTVKPIGAKHRIEIATARDADEAFQYDLRATKYAMTAVSQRMEYLAVKQTLRSTSILTNYTTLTAGSTSWDAHNSASSDPIGDLLYAIDRIRVRTGTAAFGSASARKAQKNRIKVAMHGYTWTAMREHPNCIDRIKYQGLGAVLTPEILADILMINADDLIFTNAKYTSSKEGATAAYSSFIGDDCVISLVNDSDDYNSQALGREFVFDGLGSSGDQFLVRKWIEEAKGMHLQLPYIGVSCAVDYKCLNVGAAHLFENVIDSSNTSRYADL